MAKLKVYQGSLDGRNTYCVAATSWKSAHEAVEKLQMNTSLYYMKSMWSETGNEHQVAAAMSEPGTVFGAKGYSTDYRPLRVRDDIYALTAA